MSRTVPPGRKIVSASFFWRNDQPDGLGFTLGSPAFTPADLTAMFTGPEIAKYMADSDLALGSNVVQDYLAQLSEIAQEVKRGNPDLKHAILAALNIMWLSERGFIPNDEFNGPLFVTIEGDLP